MLRKLLFFCACTFTSYSQKTKLTLQPTIALSEADINDEDGEVLNVSGIFSASEDIYLNTVGFDFQGVFYNIRGLGADQVTFLLNGVHQNRWYNHRPAWSNWGGIDGIYRTQTVTEPLGKSQQVFGNALGVHALSTLASDYRKGTRISYAMSNRSYQHKISVLHVGTLKNNWQYVVSSSLRRGEEGVRSGTAFKGHSLMVSLEKQIHKQHLISVSLLHAPTQRGLSRAYTNEVLSLKDENYNANWGYQNGKKRNARVRTIKEPLLLGTHRYKTEKIQWQNTVLLQKGTIANSRLDFNGGVNPNPTYYQRLPSYWLSRNNVDFENVFRYQQNFVNDGQLNWEQLYQANNELKAQNQTAAYALYNDHRDERRIQLNSAFTKNIDKNWSVDASIAYRNVFAENYAKVLDLLGGEGYLDVASFTLTQSDVKHPNRIVKEGDRFKYNYEIKSHGVESFLQTTFNNKRIESTVSVGMSYQSHQRTGLYQPENFENAAGKSKKANLLAFQSKLNFIYKFSPKHVIHAASAFVQRNPSIKQVFFNARVSNSILKNTKPENFTTHSLSYIYRGRKSHVKLTGYYHGQSNVTETGFYFTEGLGSESQNAEDGLLQDNSAFVQEILSGIKKRHYGIELGANYKLTSQVKLTGIVGLGNYTYANNPNLTLYAEQNVRTQNLGFVNGEKTLGNAYISDKKLATGPQQAFALKFSYSDPNYWRISVSLNHFRNNYVDVAPILYTQNFTQELDGSPIKNIDGNLVRQLRKQEALRPFSMVNVTGGKSWKFHKTYVSIFYAIQNILNKQFRTGGFTSSRAANYTERLKEFNREIPLFGNRYFVGNGRTFFVGLYVSF